MDFASIPGTFGGALTEVALSSDDEEWSDFLAALHGAFGSDRWNVKDLVGQLRDGQSQFAGKIDSAVLPGDLAQQWAHIREGKDAGFRKSLGWWLRLRKGRYAGGYRLVDAGKSSKTPYYVVEKAGVSGVSGVLSPPFLLKDEISKVNGQEKGQSGIDRPKTPETPETPAQWKD
jgi:hypothetical protein